MEPEYIMGLKKIEQGFNNMKEGPEKDILTCCGVAGGAAFIPIPYVDLAVLIPTQLMMYVMINERLGVKTLSKDALKVVGSFAFSQIMGVLGVVVGSKIAGGLLKFIPVIGTLPGIALDAIANGAITYILGMTYLGAIQALTKSGTAINTDTIKEKMKEQLSDKEKMKDIYKEAIEKMKDINFKEYKGAAEDIAEQNKDK